MKPVPNTSNCGTSGLVRGAIKATLLVAKVFIGVISTLVGIVLFAGMLPILVVIAITATLIWVGILSFLANGLNLTWAKNKLKSYE